jgi:hypothetical protein
MSVNQVYEAMELVVQTLCATKVQYAITGSVASGLYGEPVTTQDVDIIVRMTESQARQVAQTLPTRFYRSEEALIGAARDGGIVNVIDMDTAFKVDLSVVGLTPFHRDVFDRRRKVEFQPGGMKIDVVSPEDIILMKLHWRKDSRSEKQWRDALGVAQVKGARMDWKYLFEQARGLGVEDDLVRLRDEAGI